MEELVSKIKEKVKAANDSLNHARYNSTMLHRLCQEMMKIVGLLVLPTEDSQKDCLMFLRDAAAEASVLVREHARPFDLGTYLKVDDVRHKVESLCLTARACLLELGLEEDRVDIRTKLDASAVEEDKQYTYWYLSCILQGTAVDRPLSAESRRELEALITRQRHRMEFVNIIQEEELQLEGQIGEGGFGEVLKARWQGRAVAVKKLRKDLSPETRAGFYTEVGLHIQLQHPSVVRCFGATRTNAIVMELASTDLEKFGWQNGANLTWRQKVQLMLSACAGLKHLHKRMVVHRDVKTCNFLCFEGLAGHLPTVKIGDFGLAVVKAETRSKMGGPQQGTVLWMAPEIIDGAPESFASDVFSFGLVLFELVTTSQPYRNLTMPQTKLKKERGEDPCMIPDSCPRALTELLRQCIRPVPQQRPTMEEIEKGLDNILKEVGGAIQETQAELNAASEQALHEKDDIGDMPQAKRVCLEHHRQPEMDPLTAANTTINHAPCIIELVQTARTNTAECKAVQSRLEQLLDVAQRICQHPDLPLNKQVCNVEVVMESTKRVVEKYSKMTGGLQRVVQVLKAVDIQHEFASINPSLDAVLQDLNAALTAETHPTGLRVQMAVPQVQDRLQGSTLMNQMDDCARMMLRQHMPEHYVEMDVRVNAVESLLLHAKTPVVAVVGMGGIGKTTLARAVYNKMSSSKGLKLGWATVGKEANFLHCLKQIWRQLVSSKREPQCSCADDLKMELLCELEAACVLLVVDDIWSVGDLEKLRVTATNGKSKLLVTTRDVEVARRVGAEMYHVAALTKHLSMQLFCRCAFGTPHIPADKKEYSMVVNDMVRECGQLPLSLRVVGSMAKGYRGMEQWRSGAKKLQQSKSLGKTYDCDLLSVLQTSYDELDDAQKSFFFCLVGHPEDAHVMVSDLVEQWAACQGATCHGSDPDDVLLEG